MNKVEENDNKDEIGLLKSIFKYILYNKKIKFIGKTSKFIS